MEFSKEELKLLEIYLLGELDAQRYEPDGIDKDLERLYHKIKAQTNLEFEVHEIMGRLKGLAVDDGNDAVVQTIKSLP